MKLTSLLQEFLHGKLSENSDQGELACPEPPSPEQELDTTDEVTDGSDDSE
jgi:hypothetical protein